MQESLIVSMSRVFYIIIILNFFSCKKEYRYPDDPEKSKKTPNERLKGSWQIVDYTLNGAPIVDPLNKIAIKELRLTDTLNTPVSFDLREDVWLVYNLIEGSSRDDEQDWSCGIYSVRHFSCESKEAFADFHYLRIGDCDLFSKPLLRMLLITPFKKNNNTVSDWKVDKLYGSELNLSLQTDTGTYRLFFNKRE
jgi:hypothetical protein